MPSTFMTSSSMVLMKMAVNYTDSSFQCPSRRTCIPSPPALGGRDPTPLPRPCRPSPILALHSQCLATGDSVLDRSVESTLPRRV